MRSWQGKRKPLIQSRKPATLRFAVLTNENSERKNSLLEPSKKVDGHEARLERVDAAFSYAPQWLAFSAQTHHHVFSQLCCWICNDCDHVMTHRVSLLMFGHFFLIECLGRTRALRFLTLIP